MSESSCLISVEELTSAPNNRLRESMLKSIPLGFVSTDGTGDRFNVLRAPHITPKTLQLETTHLALVYNHGFDRICKLIFSTKRGLKIRRVLKERRRENHQPGIVPVRGGSPGWRLFNDVGDEVLRVDIDGSASTRIFHPV